MSLLPSTHDNNLKILRGIAKFARQNPDGSYQAEINMSPSADLTVAVKTTQAQYTSAESGLADVLDTTNLSIDRSATLTCNNLADEISAMFTISDVNVVNQSATPITGEISSQVYPGRSIQLGGVNSPGVFNVSSVTATITHTTWTMDTVYAVGDVVIPSSGSPTHLYVATVGGTSDSSAPTFPTDGSTVVDGDVTWQDLGACSTIAVNADYEVDATYGVINILATGKLADAYALIPLSVRNSGRSFTLTLGYTPTAESYTQSVASDDGTIQGVFRFYEQNAKGSDGVWFCPSTVLSPNGSLALKSGNNYGAAAFDLTFQKPSNNLQAVYRNGVPA